jgi:hypothetical protein
MGILSSVTPTIVDVKAKVAFALASVNTFYS